MSGADENRAPEASGQPETSPRADLDVDVSSSAGPYPPAAGRKKTGRKASRPIWAAAVAAAALLGLTWGLFRDRPEDHQGGGPVVAAPPLPQAPQPAAAAAPPAADRPGLPADEVIDFAPSPDQPPPLPQAPQPAVAAPPAPAPAAAPPAEKPAEKPRPEPEAPTLEPAPPAAPPAEKPAEKPAPKPEAPAAEPAPPAAEISDQWVVNISSTPDAAESLRFLSSLLSREVGGQVYAYEANLGGQVQHRIRVGFFPTREEAEAVGLKIKERFSLQATPWAVRPTKEEAAKYGGQR